MPILLTILIGVFVGFSAGMFGIGGALVATPLLRIILDLPEKIALATPLLAALPAALSGSFEYRKQGLIRFDIAWRILPLAIVGSIVGARLTAFTPGLLLMVATGLVLAYSAGLFIQRGFRRMPAAGADAPAPADEAPRPLGWEAYLGGLVAGLTSGFLAIGGGMVLVPLFVKVLRLPTKVAVATSLFCVAGLAIPGVIVHQINGYIDWPVALLLSVAVIPASNLGARAMGALRAATLERSYGIAMLLFAIFFIVRQFLP